MTNYPFDGFENFTWERLILAIQLADWHPAKWAGSHEIAVDLPSAWWMVGHAIEMAIDENKQQKERQCN